MDIIFLFMRIFLISNHVTLSQTQTCLNQDVIIKSNDLISSYVLYQNLRQDFKTNRSHYGINQNLNNLNFVNRTYFGKLMEAGRLNDISYTTLEIPLSPSEKLRYREMVAVPVMTG